MIFDQETLLSDAQAITADAASTNIIDLSPRATGIVRDIGKGMPIPLRIQVVEAFNTLTSMNIRLEVDEDSAFGSPKVVWTVNRLLAQLVVGHVITPEYIPRGSDERYLRLFYDCVGTDPTLGKITAGVVMGAQSNG